MSRYKQTNVTLQCDIGHHVRGPLLGCINYYSFLHCNFKFPAQNNLKDYESSPDESN